MGISKGVKFSFFFYDVSRPLLLALASVRLSLDHFCYPRTQCFLPSFAYSSVHLQLVHLPHSVFLRFEQ